jgi:predicted nuclease of restriction endonuclease-like (RecB) superfamily
VATERQVARRARGRARDEASFPMAPPRSELPRDYAIILGKLKERVAQERLRVVVAANTAMVLLYWDIGKVILDRQSEEGWGAKIVDRLAADLQAAFPDMRGFSPRNLKYMRAFAAAWADREIVQGPLAQIPWYHNIALLERVHDEKTR